MKYKQLTIGLLSVFGSGMIYADTEIKPSYSFSIGTHYQPTPIANQHSLSASLGTSVPIDSNSKHRLNVGVGANYSHSEPINNDVGIQKHSGYEETKANIGLSHQLSNSLNLSYNIGKPIHFNDKKFTNKEKISYGVNLQWVDTQNFAIQTFLGNTVYETNRNNGIRTGDIGRAGVKFKYGFSPKAEFSLGTVYVQYKPATQMINGQSIELSKKERGVGAIFGVDYSFDRKKKHQLGFDMETSIADIGGSLSMEYRYVF